MTLEKLQNIVLRLGNSSWCRYWVNWTETEDRQPTMCIQCRDSDGRPIRIADMEQHGFGEDEEFIYYIKRTNENGSPYISKLL